MPFLKTLEPQALAGHETADASTVFYNSLNTAGFQRMGNITPNAPAAGVAACVAQIHRIAGLSLLVPLLGRLLDEQDTGALAFTVGQCGLSIPGGETAGSVRLLWMPAAKVYQHSVLCLVPVDSSEMAFKTAAIQAFKKGFLEASPVLLEPIVSMKINVPDKYTGDVMGDLNKRRGRVLGMNPDAQHKGCTIVEADIPMLSIYGYSTDLRSMTGGSGVFSYEFARYEQAPSDIQEQEIKARQEEGADA